ncbi:MAG: ABC transporter permease subunit [Ruminococcaceae bacterium]|jgi:peptide/nickel transport system permease protein|nr:ABC transporter permease subunit [Oscillospiraceae bacterium]
MSSTDKKKGAAAGGWFKRLFFGGSKVLADEMQAKKDASLDVEEIVSPFKQIVRGFMARRLAVIAMCIVIAMFLIVFIGPLFMPKYYDAYTEVTQKNVPPTMSMLSVPGELKNHIRTIDSYGSFTVGVSDAGKVYVWGTTQIGTTGVNVRDIPEEVKNAKIIYAAAGIDHIVAIDENGKVYCWGHNGLGQYGYFDPKEFPNILSEPDELLNGTIDVNNIRKVTCGYQCSAILMNDGKLYLWGNKNTYQNIEKFMVLDNLVDIDFTLNYVVGLTQDGNSIYTGTRGLYDQYRPNINQKAIPSREYLKGRKIIAIYATSNNVCAELDDGSLCFAGDFSSNSVPMPELHPGEGFVTVCSGTYHYTGLTTEGRVLSWGGDTLNQTQVPKNMTGVSKIYAGAFQSYAVNSNGELVGKWGLKGYIFGTDTYGADIFQRIIQGGRMTMTIGAVAVIISTIIGIIIGCISGYFGGKVDLLLMRVTEIFAAIPFLPFALILSAIMAQSDISENKKIFILMCILGILTWTGLARMVRGQVLVARENEYVTAAKAMGVKEWAIAFKHILPNIVSIIFVTLTLDFATCMLTESGLSYLGFGVTYPRPTWGNMLNGANNATIIKNFWWQWVFTSLFLAITCICINIVGDTLRDVMDPKSDRDK